MSTNALWDYFQANQGNLIHKWLHYFDVYHRHFERFRDQSPTVIEIGVYHGGSLQMWREYFGPGAAIIGIDIDERCRDLADDQIEIVIGDQADREFLRNVRDRFAPVDVLIDDGGHTMVQQTAAFEELYGAVPSGGVYLVEDVHTSYWRDYGGGYRSPSSFIEYSKALVDKLNAWHSRDPESLYVDDFTRTTHSMHFYDSIVVFEKRDIGEPRAEMIGTPWLGVPPSEPPH